MSGSAVINPRRYADGCNSAQSAFTARFSGDTVWSVPTTLVDNPVAAEQLALSGPSLFLFYNGGIIEHRDRVTGKSLWTYAWNSRSRINVTSTGIELVSGAGGFYELRPDRSASPEQWLPFLGSSNVLFFLSRSEQEIRECYQVRPRPTSGPDDAVRGPKYEFVRFALDQNSVTFRYTGSGFLIDVLHHEGNDRFCIVTEEALRSFAGNVNSESEVRVMPFAKVYRAALDPLGEIIAVLQERGDGKSAKPAGLARLDRHGKPVWFCPVDAAQTVSQPPAAVGPDLVYLLVASELWRVESGKPVWRCELPGSWQEACMTVLPDESVLVAAGHYLIMVDGTGKEVYRKLLADKITCRPVVDEQGNIYVAGTAGVICLK